MSRLRCARRLRSWSGVGETHRSRLSPPKSTQGEGARRGGRRGAARRGADPRGAARRRPLVSERPVRRKDASNGPAHDGEADLVIVHPDNGLLVIEVKSGEPSRDGGGRWFIGGHALDRSPVRAGRGAKHDLVRAIAALPDWPRDLDSAPATRSRFRTSISRASPRGHVLLGPDAPREIILDAEALTSATRTRRALERALELWVGDGARADPLTAGQMALIDEFLAPTVELRRLVRRDIDDDRDRLFAGLDRPAYVLNQNRSRRRAEVIGPAGSGKSLVAVEKARASRARAGGRCSSASTSRSRPRCSARSRRPRRSRGRRPPDRDDVPPAVRDLAPRGRRPAREAEPGHPEWCDETLPTALDAAIEELPDARFHAIVIDEGQDFDARLARCRSSCCCSNPRTTSSGSSTTPARRSAATTSSSELGLASRSSCSRTSASPAPIARASRAGSTADRRAVAVARGRAGGRGSSRPSPGAPTVEAVRRRSTG